MAVYDRRYDPVDTPPRTLASRGAPWFSGIIAILIASAIAIGLVMALMYPQLGARLGDTNTGPSVRTVTPQPAPSTSPAVPMPTPTTEPRPTQAPIR